MFSVTSSIIQRRAFSRRQFRNLWTLVIMETLKRQRDDSSVTTWGNVSFARMHRWSDSRTWRRNIIVITTAIVAVIYKIVSTSYYYVGSIVIDNSNGDINLLSIGIRIGNFASIIATWRISHLLLMYDQYRNLHWIEYK